MSKNPRATAGDNSALGPHLRRGDATEAELRALHAVALELYTHKIGVAELGLYDMRTGKPVTRENLAATGVDFAAFGFEIPKVK